MFVLFMADRERTDGKAQQHTEHLSALWREPKDHRTSHQNTDEHQDRTDQTTTSVQRAAGGDDIEPAPRNTAYGRVDQRAAIWVAGLRVMGRARGRIVCRRCFMLRLCGAHSATVCIAQSMANAPGHRANQRCRAVACT
jgi:hypothetical protein